MKKYRTRSLFQLTFIGFTVVSLPLLAALVLAISNVDAMVRHSQSAIYDSTQAMQFSQQLVKKLTELERHARQFLVLGDADVFELYLEGHHEFSGISKNMRELSLGEKQREILSEMISIEQNLHTKLLKPKSNNNEVIKSFRDLASLGQNLIVEGGRNIRKNAAGIQRQAETTKNLLIWQSIALIPLALIIAMIFIILITRPLKQIGRSIYLLGSNDYNIPISINGPRDLEHLGTRLEWLRNRLANLEAQKTSVLRHISHDLKTPLTALREGTELLVDNTPGTLNLQQREIVNILRTNCLKLQKQVEELLRFGASQSYLEASAKEIVDVPFLLHEVVSAHKLVIKSKHLTFKGNLMDCKVLGDPTQLRVIFDNLFSNAIRYSPDNGIISVFLKVQGTRLVLDMKDQGPGIDPDDKDQLFDPYYQGKRTSKGAIKGTGLGLAIAQEFARLHLGSIEVISNSAGTGAHFKLTLPMEI